MPPRWCIAEWKRGIFLTNNPGLDNQFVALSLPGIRRWIQTMYRSESRCTTAPHVA